MIHLLTEPIPREAPQGLPPRPPGCCDGCHEDLDGSKARDSRGEPLCRSCAYEAVHAAEDFWPRSEEDGPGPELPSCPECGGELSMYREGPAPGLPAYQMAECSAYGDAGCDRFDPQEHRV